ncbi:MAG: heme lyase CcmF/NrfE family subunit [Anaerolineales bacterium]|nr:heme lyase CcmF/NrfE family subunit [Anaerolineales bacterium]
MLVDVGYFALLLVLAATVYAAALAVAGARLNEPGWVESARRALLGAALLLTLSSICLLILLAGNRFDLEFIATVTSRAMPLYLKLTAWWGGQAGSLHFWAWLLSSFGAAAMLRDWRQERAALPYVIAILAGTLAFFVSLVVFVDNPFARLWQSAATGEVTVAMFPPPGALAFAPLDGRGLNPLLRHPGMIIHPPLLYLGFVAFVVPFAFAMAALITGRFDAGWIRSTRRWTLAGWLFLSLGLLLGGRWAYDVLGWGGYWGWDPVENAALMPWLTGTALLHSAVVQERRGLLKRWNLTLVILTYGLVIFGTFLSRSGVISSVHAFAQSAIGPLFFAFIAITLLGSLGLLWRGWDGLADEQPREGWFSREGAFLLNNYLFLGLTVSVFWGTVYPMLSEAVTGSQITVGPPYYRQVTGPLFAALVLLMGIAPLLAWRQASARRLGAALCLPLAAALMVMFGLAVAGLTSLGGLFGYGLVSLVGLSTVLEYGRGAQARCRATGEGWPKALVRLITRSRRRYGGYAIHLGVVLIALGVIGTTFFQIETQGRLAPGESLTIGRYTLTYIGLDEALAPDDRIVTTATVDVAERGTRLARLYPHRDLYVRSGQPMTIAGLHSDLAGDVYVILADWEELSSAGATFKVYVNPLINFIWLGGAVFVLGTLIAAWPERRRAVARSVAAPPAHRAPE